MSLKPTGAIKKSYLSGKAITHQLFWVFINAVEVLVKAKDSVN